MILLFWSAMAAWASEPKGPSPNGHKYLFSRLNSSQVHR
jgi:hypothetical protein